MQIYKKLTRRRSNSNTVSFLNPWQAMTGNIPVKPYNCVFWELSLILFVNESQSLLVWGGNFLWSKKVCKQSAEKVERKTRWSTFKIYQLCCLFKKLLTSFLDLLFYFIFFTKMFKRYPVEKPVPPNILNEPIKFRVSRRVAKNRLLKVCFLSFFCISIKLWF